MIGFLTDWGHDSYYVGVTKAIIKEISPKSEIIDITHTIEPFNIKKAAYIMDRVVSDFPQKTIFLAVVDPSVGTSRKSVLIRMKNGMTFVGPDNGLFTFVIERLGVHEIRELENRQYFYGKSVTFHGRDVFAPVAAHIENGVTIEKFGSRLMTYEVLRYKVPAREGHVITGEVAFCDGFGNIETNIPSDLVSDFEEGDSLVLKNGKRKFTITFANTYFDVRTGEGLIHCGSNGFLEISVNKGDAKTAFGISQGDPIEIMRE